MPAEGNEEHLSKVGYAYLIELYSLEVFPHYCKSLISKKSREELQKEMELSEIPFLKVISPENRLENSSNLPSNMKGSISRSFLSCLKKLIPMRFVSLLRKNRQGNTPGKSGFI